MVGVLFIGGIRAGLGNGNGYPVQRAHYASRMRKEERGWGGKGVGKREVEGMVMNVVRRGLEEVGVVG